jgi:hypothetical protein
VVVVLVFRPLARTQRTCAGVQVLMRLGRMNDRFFNIIRSNVHDMRFRVIEPDNSVKMGHGNFSYLIENSYSLVLWQDTVLSKVKSTVIQQAASPTNKKASLPDGTARPFTGRSAITA